MLGSSLIVLIQGLLFFLIILNINSGIFHIYEILMIIFGYTLIAIKNKKWYNLYGDNMSKKKIPSDSKRRLAFFGTLSVLAIILFFGQLFSYTYKIYNLKKEIDNLNKKIENEKFTEKELRQEIEKFSNDEYKAKYIREHYSYSKDGEYIIKIKEKEKTKKDE